MSRAAWLLGGLLGGLVLAGPAGARTLQVGPGQALLRPSQAAGMARAGDTVLIAPGTYYDCAIWRANRLTIAGTGPGVVMTDRACAGKAAFVIDGDDVTVRNITFQRIRVPDNNGAGIRAEGGNLTVEDAVFLNNQAAILTADRAGAVLRIQGTRFIDNGGCREGRCTDTLMVGRWGGLEVLDSSFERPRGGLAISSDAAAVTLRGNHIVGGPGAALMLLTVRDSVRLRDNVLEQPKGGPPAVKLTGGAGVVEMRGNSYRGGAAGGTFVLNWSGASPVMQGNTVGRSDTELSTRGAWWERLRLGAHAVYDPARRFAGKVKGKLESLAAGGLGKLRHLLPF